MTHRTPTLLWPTLVFTLCLSGCLSPGPNGKESSAPALSDADLTSPEFRLTADFDRFARGEMSAEQQAEITKTCKADSGANPFCFSYLKATALQKKKRERERLAKPLSGGKPDPIVPVLKNGKVQKWSNIRRARVSALLAGLSDASVENLQALGKYALKAPGCPNNLAIAVAAMLESFAHEPKVLEPIARLYEKGGDCSRRNSADREHFYTRAALFDVLQKNNHKAERLLARVRPTDAFSGRALYWLARVRTAIGDTKGATAATNRLHATHPFSFHTLVSFASQNVDALAEYDTAQNPTTKRSVRNKKVNTLIEQAELLKRFGFTATAELVVDWALDDFRPFEPQVRLYLGELGSPRSKCLVLGDVLLRRRDMRSRTALELAYPKAYLDLFEKRKGTVDPFLLLSIARKESTLDPKAISPANAQGLLQINPDTAKRLSSKSTIDLLDPETNAELSAKYVGQLLNMTKNQLPLVLASYNAGEEAVFRWVKRYPTADPLLFIDLIPYRETRDYVGFVMANYYWYKRLYGNGASNPLTFLTNTELARVEAPESHRGVQSESDPTTPDDPMEVEESFEADDENSAPIVSPF